MTPMIPERFMPRKNANKRKSGCTLTSLPTNFGDNMYPSQNCPNKYTHKHIASLMAEKFANIPTKLTDIKQKIAPINGINDANPDSNPQKM